MTGVASRVRESALTDRHLRFLAAGLAYFVAALHLFHPTLGTRRLVIILSVNPALLLTDPRPAAFVLSAFAIITGVTLVLVGFPRRPIYLLGMLLMATFLVGYFAWHLTGHGGFLPGREPVYHGLQPHVAVIEHMRTDTWAFVSVVAEGILVGVLAILYRREP